MTMSQSEYHIERERQTEILHKAVEKVIQDIGAQFETPMLNAAIGALVASLAESIAAIGDHRIRKQMRKTVDAELSAQIAKLVVAGRPSSRTEIVRGGLH